MNKWVVYYWRMTARTRTGRAADHCILSGFGLIHNRINCSRESGILFSRYYVLALRICPNARINHARKHITMEVDQCKNCTAGNKE